MSQNIKEALQYDSLSEAEKITGCEYKDDEATTFLGMLLMQDNAAVKRRLLSESNDVHWQSTLAEYIGVVTDLGFEKLLDEPIPNTNDRYRIFWRDGVLLTLDSYWDDKSINSANALLNFRGPREALDSCSNGYAGEVDGKPVWDVKYDAREGLRYRLTSLADRGTILSQWIKPPFLWLLHYQDSKQDGYDYEVINASRIANFPQHVREAICREPNSPSKESK